MLSRSLISISESDSDLILSYPSTDMEVSKPQNGKVLQSSVAEFQ
jgi:hypothetical protein